MPPQTSVSSFARTFTGAAARGGAGLAVQGVGAFGVVKGGGVSCISSDARRRAGGGGWLDAFGSANCIFARAITASQSSSSSA